MKRTIKNKSGFTLTEVMIGIMILTVAIVSATNLLVGLIRSNQNNLTTLQAYYLAQEGIEAVRNIRDTNWLHNLDWLGADSAALWNEFFVKDDDRSYVVNLDSNSFQCSSNPDDNAGLLQIGACRPWSIERVVDNGSGRILKYNAPNGGDVYLTSGSVLDGVETPFSRIIKIRPYNCEDLGDQGLCNPDDLDKYILVESKVTWQLGSKERELVLHEILTNWKDAAL